MVFFDPHGFVIGVDEVGRGAIAGPVVAAACLFLSKNTSFCEEHVRDSKKLSAKQRAFCREHIENNAIFAIGSASVAEIEHKNILNATMLAMDRAIKELYKKIQTADYKVSSVVIVDGNKAPNDFCKPIVKGDDKFFEIAAASIIAKTTRDAIMQDLAKSYPDYCLEKNAGYGTPKHLATIKSIGPSDAHRKSWIKNTDAQGYMF